MHQTSDTNAAQKVCRLLRVLSTPQPLRHVPGAEALVLGVATQGRDPVRDRARPARVRLAGLVPALKKAGAELSAHYAQREAA